jgi:hypothetical protein
LSLLPRVKAGVDAAAVSSLSSSMGSVVILSLDGLGCTPCRPLSEGLWARYNSTPR